MDSVKSKTVKESKTRLDKNILSKTKSKKMRKTSRLIENAKNFHQNLENYEIITFIKRNLLIEENNSKIEKEIHSMLEIEKNNLGSQSVESRNQEKIIDKNTDSIVDKLFFSNQGEVDCKKSPIQIKMDEKVYLKSLVNIKGPKLPAMNTDHIKEKSFYQNNLSSQNFLKFDENDIKRKRILRKSRKLVYDSFSEEEIENLKIQSKWLIPHGSSLKKDWDMLISIIILYYTFAYPLILCFGGKYYHIYFISDTIIDLIFIIDFSLNFITEYLDEYDQLVSNYLDITLYYFTSWFFFDLITSFPYNTFIVISYNCCMIDISYSKSSIFSLINWIRVLRSVRLDNNKLTSTNIFSNLFSKFEPKTMRLLNFSLFLIIITHIFCCFFIFIGFNSDSLHNWLIQNNLETNTEIYISSVYYIFASIFTIGYGDIVPLNISERSFVIFVLTVGCGIFSYALSSVSSILASVNSKQILYLRKQKILEEIKSDHKLPFLLDKQIRRSFKNYYDNADQQIMSIFEILPSSIKNKLYIQMYEKQIQKLRFFQNQSYEFILTIIPLLKTGHFQKNNLIISLGDFVDEIYMVSKGTIKIEMSQDFNKYLIGTICQGNHFGDIIMYTNEQSSFNYLVKSKLATILILKKSDFANLKFEFSNEINQILSISFEIFKEIEMRKNIVLESLNNKENANNIKKRLKELNITVFNKVEQNFRNDRNLLELSKMIRNNKDIQDPRLDYKREFEKSEYLKSRLIKNLKIQMTHKLNPKEFDLDNINSKLNQETIKELEIDNEMEDILKDVQEIDEKIQELNQCEAKILKVQVLAQDKKSSYFSRLSNGETKLFEKKEENILNELESILNESIINERKLMCYQLLDKMFNELSDFTKIKKLVKSKVKNLKKQNSSSGSQSSSNDSDSLEETEIVKKVYEKKDSIKNTNIGIIKQHSQSFNKLENNYLSFSENNKSGKNLGEKIQDLKFKKVPLKKHQSSNLISFSGLDGSDQKKSNETNNNLSKRFSNNAFKKFKDLRKKSLFNKNEKSGNEEDFNTNKEKNTFIEKLGEDIELGAFMNKNQYFINDYLKDFIQSEKKIKKKSSKNLKNQISKLDSVFKNLQKLID